MRWVLIPPAPAILSGKAATRERAAAIEFYAVEANRTSKFPGDYKAYKHRDVRQALLKAFDGKCAYCDSPIKATQPVAIEHYRPKGEVTISGRRTPPGYYWLASTWENLLPSCTDCNSPRAQDFPSGLPRTAGKANAFPVVSERRRAHRPDEELKEGRLLLHPYLDEPDDYLEYVWDTDSLEDGEIRPQGPPRTKQRRMATTSIEVYALQRIGLIERRRDVLRLLLAHLQTIRDTMDDIAEHPNDTRFKQRFERQVRDLTNYTHDRAPYSAMCNQVVDEFGRRELGR
jgi:uncharacterized protein (TIGR02646 family)